MTVNLVKNTPESLINFLQKGYTLEELNSKFRKWTKVQQFFRSENAIKKFIDFLNNPEAFEESARDLGDFQTPRKLTDQICQYLYNENFKPKVLIEPTCGTGNFIISALKIFPSIKYVYCIELQEKLINSLKYNLIKNVFISDLDIKIELYKDNIFSHTFSKNLFQMIKRSDSEILIIGNPPWITSAELTVLDSNNIPQKVNIKRDRGIDAITGKGNFDVSEYIIIKLLKEFNNFNGKIAMLCKTVVIKNLIKNIKILGFNITNIKELRINSKKEFGINTESALFYADIGSRTQDFCSVYSLYDPKKKFRVYGWCYDKFVSDIEKYKHYRYMDGNSQYEWRHGIKHDASKIMVLEKHKDGKLYNGLGVAVLVEPERLYPFVKSSEIRMPILKEANKRVIITQKNLKEDTKIIRDQYPKLWAYLMENSEYLDRRKSIVYKNRPKFSIFGVGNYAFMPYKIAISGFYKEPIFCLILPIKRRPVMLDDTIYYLSFDNLDDAIITWIILNLSEVREFLKSITFLDSKRPYTKDKLMRIDLINLLNRIDFGNIREFYQTHLECYYEYNLEEKRFLNYIKNLKTNR